MKISFALKKHDQEPRVELLITCIDKDIEFRLTLGTYKELTKMEEDISSIKSNLDNITHEAKKYFDTKLEEKKLNVQELWEEMSKLQDKEFISFFNSLGDSLRKQLVDHVLAKCNVFSGKGRLISEYLNQDTMTLEL